MALFQWLTEAILGQEESYCMILYADDVFLGLVDPSLEMLARAEVLLATFQECSNCQFHSGETGKSVI